jgi:hypothetical protein
MARRRTTSYFGKQVSAVRRGPKGGVSRRQFLAGTTLAGIALGMPPWLIGCGSDDDGGRPGATKKPTPIPVPGPRELRTLQFGLSLGVVRNPRLFAFGSRSDQKPLVEHTDASRARFRRNNPVLGAVPDEQLTHYLEDVDLPSDALQLIWVIGEDDDGDPVVAGTNINVPVAALTAASEGSIAQGPPIGVARELADYVSPTDTAVSLVFQTHELMNLDVDQGASIMNLIATLPCSSADDSSCTPYLDELAFLVASKGQATTSGGWATLVPATDMNGQPILDDKNNQVYRWVLDDEVAQTASSVAGKIRTAVFNDPAFRGTNWHPGAGMTESEGAALAAPTAAAGFAVTSNYPPGTSAHGIAFETLGVVDQASRTVKLEFRNEFLRYLSAFVQFANAKGDLPVLNPTGDDTVRAKSLGIINSNYTVLGIPLIGNSIELSSVTFDVPAEASLAKVYFGSLGLGGQAFSPEAVNGSIWTLVFNIGVPTLCLAAGVAVSATLLKSLQKNALNATVNTAMRALIPLVVGAAGPGIANGIFGASESGSAVPVLTALATALVTALLVYGDFPFFGGVNILGQTTNLLAGPFGLALRAFAVIVDLATIAQSVGEVLASPAIFINTVGLTQTTTVTFSHDPDDFRFPATARHYEVALAYDSASTVTYKRSGAIEAGRVAPIDVVFEGVPSGGMVTVDVYLTDDAHCIVGRSVGADGKPGPYGPVPGTQSEIAFTIAEKTIPLLQDTQYVHQLKLEYQDGHHVWVATPDGPTATRADLIAGQDNALNDVTAITISQRTGMAGYAYQAGGQGVPYCGQSNTGSMSMHVLQNIFLAENPDSGLKQLPCGFQQTASIVYDKLGPASGSGRNFLLQPTPNGYLLQAITLDVGTPIDLSNPLAWGMFSQAMDSLAVVPSGHVVGVNRQTHKMQILELPPAAVDRNQAPQAVPFAVLKMGFGTRVGLLNAPVAVTVSGTTILVLENGNQRLQALDVPGNPVLLFKNGTTNIVDLDKGSGIVYLDIGVEGMGYIYVLSYVNDGMSAGDYRLDVYTPQGNQLTRTTGVSAARLAVDTFRNLYTLNYETVANAPRIEPSLSQWAPVTPSGCTVAPAA